jgi:hypothetical protein
MSVEQIIAIRPDSIPPEELDRVLADCIALQRVHAFRCLLGRRLVALACVAFLVGSVVPRVSVATRVISVLMLLVPPLCVWVVEHRMGWRLQRRLEHVGSGPNRR